MPSRKIPSSTGSRVCPWHKAFFFASVSFDAHQKKLSRRRRKRLTFASRVVRKRKRQAQGRFVCFAAAKRRLATQRSAAAPAAPGQIRIESVRERGGRYGE